MRRVSRVMGMLALSVGIAAAKDSKLQQGTILSENSVQCGSQEKGKKTSNLMCQEYVVRTEQVEYHVRQEKQQHKDMLPVNAAAEMSISKDKMKLKVDGKSFEMMIVSEQAVQASPTATPVAAAAQSKQ
jgi:hypothetical protein